MKEKIHLDLVQRVEETVTPLQLEMLRRLYEHADETSVLKGTVHVSMAYDDTLDFFSRFPDFHIIADSTAAAAAGGVIPEINDGDPAVGRWLSSAVSDVILEHSYSIVVDEVHKKYAVLSREDDMKFDDGCRYTGLYGNAFKYIPRVYYHAEQVDGNWQYLFSLAPIVDETKFFEAAGIGKYLACVVDGKLVSRPNTGVTRQQTMSSFWNYAQQNGVDYGLFNYPQWQKLNALYLSKYGTRDCKTVIGPGFSASSSQNYWGINTGITTGLGDGSGQVQYDTYGQMKLFGIEALWGQAWQFVPNIRFYNSGSTAAIYEGNIVSNDAPALRVFNKLNNASGTFTKKMVLGSDFDLLPTSVGGTVDTYWTTGCWAATDGQLFLVGGASNFGSLCGLSCANSSNGFSISHASIGARLAFYGSLSDYEAISGQEMVRLNG